jgi:hypothetical protein
MKKVLGRKHYAVSYLINRLPYPPFKEIITVRDFTTKKPQ